MQCWFCTFILQSCIIVSVSRVMDDNSAPENPGVVPREGEDSVDGVKVEVNSLAVSS